MTDPDRTYRMTLSLNLLNHLGLNLYSNVPAVLSEVVANAWDADAEKVEIEIDTTGKITITDDGHGMSVEDANERYLLVGYERRNHEGRSETPKFKRKVMGRKGIGKLSLFSIAENIEVHSAKDGEFHGFILESDAIKEIIKEGKEEQYHPKVVSPSNIQIRKGTRIILTDVKRQLYRSSVALRQRLARRFSVIGPNHQFRVFLDEREILPEDRGYQDKIQYIWTFDERGNKIRESARNLARDEERYPGLTVNGQAFNIGGWIGTARKAGDLKLENGESLNGIVILVRGKLAQEDILEEFSEGGVYSKYIFGEIHADFLDEDDQDDIATTSRQKIFEDDPRYIALHNKLQGELRYIGNHWTDIRNEEGMKVAEQSQAIRNWLQGLNPEHRKIAQRLFGRINQLPVDSDTEKRQLFIGNILAFESLRFRHLTEQIEKIADDDLTALSRVFTQLDDLEASAYYQIIRDRLDVINKLINLVDDNAKEKAIQTHLFNHLWLLDPSWERATSTEIMERRIRSALDAASKPFTEDELYRLDIYYMTTGGKHVIIELKRAGRALRTEDLISQISKYHGEVSKVLTEADRQNERVEFVCVVGRQLQDWSNPGGRERSDNTLDGQNARVVMYDHLIDNAQAAYRDYLSKQKETERLSKLLTDISEEDFKTLSPDS